MAELYLGLGSNIGCRLTHLRSAVKKISQIPALTIKNVSPIYRSKALLKDDAPAAWNQDFFNAVLQCEYHDTPENLLKNCKLIESALNRESQGRWSPRTIDIDILTYDTLTLALPHLSIPHCDILNRSFVLKPLLDINPYWQHPHHPDLDLKTLAEALAKKQMLTRSPLRLTPPYLMGVLNVTPDSFSDGGLFDNTEAARAQFRNLIEAGAEVIDIGAESTRPYQGFGLITPEIEWARLEPILEACFHELEQLPVIYQPKISIDTRHLKTMEKLLNRFPIHWINDQEGHDLEKKIALIKGTSLRYIRMHHCGIPHSNDKIIQGDPVKVVHEFALKEIERLVGLGLDLSQIIVDFGIGFGKKARETHALLSNLQAFHDLPVDTLLGFSRKIFLQSIHPCEAHERDLETAVLTGLLPEKSYTYLRVHNVEYARRALSIKDWFHAA